MSQSILDLEAPPADRRIRYGADPLHFADLRYPVANKPWPVVMNIHGGFWRACYDLTHAGHLCAALTEAGFATCNLEYRRVGNPGGGWPGTLEDIRAAYKYVCRHTHELDFDADRIVVMGHSAGGQLALALAAYEPSITRAVSLAGALDLRRAYDLHLSNDAVVEFLHGTPEQVPQYYRDASPMDLSIRAHQTVVTGTVVDDVPPDFSRLYAQKKKELGETVEFIEIPNANHMDLIDPRSQAFEVIVRALQDLLSN
jgi:acetyl esterase/lipase